MLTLQSSLIRRLSYTLTAIVTAIVLIFSGFIMFYNMITLESQLEQQLHRTVQLAEMSLESAVWQLNPDSIHDILEAIFIDETIVYACVISDHEILGVKMLPEFAGADFLFFRDPSQFITQTLDIEKDQQIIGHFQIAMSRQNIRREMLLDLFTIALLTLAIIASISIVSIIIAKRHVLQPLSALVESVTFITEGKLDVPMKLKPERAHIRDEIGELSRAFDVMRQRLQQMIIHIRKAGEKIQIASENIFMAVNQLAAALEQQSASIVQTTATMETMTTTFRQISGNTKTVADMSEQTRTVAQKGVTFAQEMIQKMQDIQETNTQFQQKILSLGERSGKIGDVIEIINDIADRTKLIAFNAALEAVGASDTTGKRFNVVAIEIRRLADSIIESTEEISRNILEIQGGIRELVLSSNLTTQRITEGTQQTKIMNTGLQEILGVANRTTDEAKQIAMATQDQQLAHDQMLFALKEISDSTQQFVGAGNQVSKIATEMKTLAQELYHFIHQFELSEEDAATQT
ncbi:methyl-accepting chemotaxis sensory transducer [Candidatus Vecturithrix granuli]|uniref:Methyl-accepting chemotaxis sensory transducer n=1 Tax=Vecturithrix granuli TaxID=1499967 RepID=A0A081C4E7_VECG1|nr:methyl-accepting chemotaxis sensory transducer [Candidatus Vecturithrix granuli]